MDTGATFASLTRASHVHMFGISFIFMFVGLIFSFAETTTTQYKCIAIGIPYAFLVADIVMVVNQNSPDVRLAGYFFRYGHGRFIHVYVDHLYSGDVVV